MIRVVHRRASTLATACRDQLAQLSGLDVKATVNYARAEPNTTTPEGGSVSSTNASAGFASAELFRDLSPTELQRLEGLAHRRHYEPGAVIRQEGQGGIAFFVLTAGQAVVTRLGNDGQHREIRKIGPGGAFGGMALFSDRPRSATVTAVEPTDCLALHRLEFLEELRRSPDVALRLLDSLAIRLDQASALT